MTYSALNVISRRRDRLRDLPLWLARRSVVCLDFDGVFLDSNGFKVRCMRQALADFETDRVEKFLAYFRMNFGNSRQHHFQVFHASFAGKPLEFEPFYDTYAGRYARLVSEGYTRLNLTPGCRAILEALNQQGTRCHIVTGGDPAQVNKVIAHKGIAQLIASVRGAPVKKAVHIGEILAKEQCPTDRAIIFGDGVADGRAAVETGLDFVFVEGFSFADERLIGEVCPSFRSIRDLAADNLSAARTIAPSIDQGEASS